MEQSMMDSVAKPDGERRCVTPDAVSKHLAVMTRFVEEIDTKVRRPLQQLSDAFYGKTSGDPAMRKTCERPTIAELSMLFYLTEILTVWRSCLKIQSCIDAFLKLKLPEDLIHAVMWGLDEHVHKLMGTAWVLYHTWSGTVTMTANEPNAGETKAPDQGTEDRNIVLKAIQSPEWLERRVYFTNLCIQCYITDLQSIVQFLRDSNGSWAKITKYENLSQNKLVLLLGRLPNATTLGLWAKAGVTVNPTGSLPEDPQDGE